MLGWDAKCQDLFTTLKYRLNYNYFRCDGFENWRYSIQNVDGSSVIRHHGIETKRTTPVQNIEDID